MKINNYSDKSKKYPHYIIDIVDKGHHYFVKIYDDYSGIQLPESGFNTFSEALKLISFIIQHKKEISTKLGLDLNRII